MIKRWASVSLMLALLCGCIDNTYQYETSAPNVDVTSSGEIAVGVLDQRPFVLSGDKTSNFVGLQRSGLGNPFDVKTESGDPLADDFADTIVRSLNDAGVKARSIYLAPTAGKQGAIDILRNSGADKSVLIIMDFWKTDTYATVTLKYDLNAEVYDNQGQLLAKSHQAAKKGLGGSWNPPEHARQAVPQEFRNVMEDLFANEDIEAALR